MFIITAEDNWRNDYPDEEDLFHSDSEEEGQHSRAAYRYHNSYGMGGNLSVDIHIIGLWYVIVFLSSAYRHHVQSCLILLLDPLVHL